MQARGIKIPDSILEEVYRHAREEFPNECCGWLTAPRESDEIDRVRRAVNAYDPSTHPTSPNRTPETAYVIFGNDLLELNNSLDGPEPPRVIYHSHPNGKAYLSPIDRRNAIDPWSGNPAYDVQQLVVGITAERVVEARVYDWDYAKRKYIEVASTPTVTSTLPVTSTPTVNWWTRLIQRLRLMQFSRAFRGDSDG